MFKTTLKKKLKNLQKHSCRCLQESASGKPKPKQHDILICRHDLLTQQNFVVIIWCYLFSHLYHFGGFKLYSPMTSNFFSDKVLGGLGDELVGIIT